MKYIVSMDSAILAYLASIMTTGATEKSLH